MSMHHLWMKRNSFLPNKYKKKQQKKTEQTEHKTEKWTTLIQGGQKQTSTLADKIHSEHLKNINKIEKYKNTELQSVNEWTHNQWRQKQIDTLSD